MQRVLGSSLLPEEIYFLILSICYKLVPNCEKRQMDFSEVQSMQRKMNKQTNKQGKDTARITFLDNTFL